MRDLKKCTVDQDWMSIAQNRDQWSAIIEAAANEVNERDEEMEKIRKDKRKERGERKQVYVYGSIMCARVCLYVHHCVCACVCVVCVSV